MTITEKQSAASSGTFTIGRLARAANVGVETIRYYQSRGLLPTPDGSSGYRQYPAAQVGRIRFIKRAQELGWSLDEIASLLRLEDGTNRRAIRTIAKTRLEQIDAQLADLNRMKRKLSAVLAACEHSDAAVPCPIIECLADPAPRAR